MLKQSRNFVMLLMCLVSFNHKISKCNIKQRNLGTKEAKMMSQSSNKPFHPG